MAFSETLRQELLQMRVRDQEMRNKMGEKYKSGESLSSEDEAWWADIDTTNTRRMQEIIAEHGWPGKSFVGEDGSFNAWLLVQHADKQVDFQKQCLELLRTAVEAGEASAQNLAYLTDRVRANEDLPQVYGTQCHTVDGELVSREIEDAEHVDQRRAAIGLKPVAEYLASMKS